jgi:polyisoprenoid-binding protein YceI
METQNYKIDSSQSSIDWTGRKVTGSHNGTIAITDGSLTMAGGILTGGNFVIDTTSIKILDVTDPATNAQFAGHLASDDFFSAEKYPNALFEITSVTPKADAAYHIEGNLTIKGITEPVAFDATVNTCSGELQASGKIVIDRTKFGMRFRSGNFFKDLGDNLIYNEIDLQVFITAKS